MAKQREEKVKNQLHNEGKNTYLKISTMSSAKKSDT